MEEMIQDVAIYNSIESLILPIILFALLGIDIVVRLVQLYLSNDGTLTIDPLTRFYSIHLNRGLHHIQKKNCVRFKINVGKVDYQGIYLEE